MSENFDIEEQLREHLLNASEPSPPDLFAQIEAQIEGKEKRKKRFFIWFWFGAGMAIIASGILWATSKGITVDNSTAAITETCNNNDTINNLAVEPTLNNNENEILLVEGESNTIEPAPNNNFETENDALSASTNSNIISDNNTESNSDTTILNTNENLVSNETGGNGTQFENQSLNTTAISTPNNSLAANVLIETNPNSTEEEEKDSTIKTGIQNGVITNLAQLQARTIEPSTSNATLHLANNNALPAASLNNDKTDSTIVQSSNSDSSNDSTLVVDQIVADTVTNIAENELPTLDSIPSIDSTTAPTEEPKPSKFGLLAYGGYMAFDQAVFKSYFTSGNLSQVAFPSSGFEIGLGGYYRFKNRFEFSLAASYGQRHTSFNYNLMISESDFFDLYENDTEIPLENLDDPNSCNCFLAEDASLDYSVSTLALNFTGSFDLIKKSKFSFGPLVGIGLVANTKFTNIGSTVIGFSPELNERFTGSILKFGLNFHYQITPKLQVGTVPSFNFQFANKSTIYVRNSRLLLLPLQFKIAL